MKRTLAGLTRAQLRHGEAITRARVTAPFASTAYARRRKRFHMVNGTEGYAVWSLGEFRRMAVAMKCGVMMARPGVRLHVQPPDDIELCDYCALVDLGPGAAAASAVIARLKTPAA